MNQLVREALALVLAVLAGGVLVVLAVVLVLDGEGGRAALLGGALALGALARWFGRYDPAQPGRVAGWRERLPAMPWRVDLRNRAPRG